MISFDVTFPQAISANGWSVSLPEEGKAADDDNYKDCWLFLSFFPSPSFFLFVFRSVSSLPRADLTLPLH